MTTLTHITFDGVTIPVTTPCRAKSPSPSGEGAQRADGAFVTPTCQIIAQRDHCAGGEIEQAYCTSCGEVVYQNII